MCRAQVRDLIDGVLHELGKRPIRRKPVRTMHTFKYACRMRGSLLLLDSPLMEYEFDVFAHWCEFEYHCEHGLSYDGRFVIFRSFVSIMRAF